MMARHGIDCEDKQKPSKHGNDIADGDAQVAGRDVKKLFNDGYDKGTQNMVHQLASKYPCPKTEQNVRYCSMEGLYSTTRYVYIYMPEDRIHVEIVETGDGYLSSSKSITTGQGATLKRRPGCFVARGRVVACCV